ncbi:caspase domain-containing protein [Streptomyces triculaminicus]|uniref:caspase domain-containing protein n=1 Tax=Streptomyces triculaminicus TaxID=2816232 RepID=UPI0037CF296C
MSRLQMPAGMSGPLRELMVELHRLHAEAGWPSVRSLAKGQGFSHFTAHQMFTLPQLPRATVYAAVVATLAQLHPWDDEDEINDRMARLWRAAHDYEALELNPDITGPLTSQEDHVLHARSGAALAQEQHPIPPGHMLSSSPAVLVEDHSAELTDLPDPDRSKAVLIGIGRFTDPQLSDLPTVVPGTRALHRLLATEPEAALPTATIVSNGHRREILDTLYDAAETATDTLLLYYGGHGLLARSGELTLAATDTNPDRPFSSVPYNDVREVLALSRARRKVLILDCCFAGRAVQEAMGPLSGLAEVSGACLICSTSATGVSLAPANQPYPAFTGALLDILQVGVEGGPKLLDLSTIVLALKERMGAQGLPRPSVRRNGQIHLALGWNHASDHFRKSMYRP